MGRIIERGRGFFGERGCAWLLKVMEDCFEGNFKEPFKRVWNEGGRGYKLELHNNKAGRFLLCSAVCIKGKRFSLAFPKGKVFQGVWKTLATSLRSIGVVPKARPLEEV